MLSPRPSVKNCFFLTAIRLLNNKQEFTIMFYLIIVPWALQKCFTLYILVVYIAFYIVGILQTAKEEFQCTEKHVTITVLFVLNEMLRLV